MSGIERYYRDKTLLITGGTGLLGKVLLESVLRRLSVRKVRLLIRPREAENGGVRSPAERLRAEIIGSSAFRLLRARHGDRFDGFIAERVEAVAGDLARDRLGMEPEVYERLTRDTDIVIHAGALAVFDAPLDRALETNAIGPLRVLQFARDCPRTPFVAHVSSCYVNRLAGPLFESPLDPEEALEEDPALGPYDVDREVRAIRERVERLRGHEARGPARRRTERIRESLVEEGMAWSRRRGWNDVYTFTKAMGEQLVVRHRGDVPGLILRPSILESSLHTPEPGWMDGFRMMDPLIIAFARGQLFEFPGNPESIVDVVPADMAANALLAAIPRTHAQGEPLVYQVASGMENPLVLREFVDHLIEYFERTPLGPEAGGGRPLPELSFPETGPFLQQLRYRYLIPLRIAERIAGLLRLVPIGRRAHAAIRSRRVGVERLGRYANIYGPYAESQARFLTFNVRHLWRSLSPRERERFPFDVSGLSWRRYVQDIHLPGIETHILGLRREDGRRVEPSGGPETASSLAPFGVPAEDGQRTVRLASFGAPGDGGRPGDGDGGRPGPGDGRHPADRRRADGTGGDGPLAEARDWSKAERVLSVTDQLEPGEVERWTTSLDKRILRKASRSVIRAIARHHLELECAGQRHLPERGPFVVVSNHTSHVDTGVLLAALGPLAASVHPAAATDYWFRNPALGWLLHCTLGAIPFDRNSQNVSRALALPAGILRTGGSLIFFPEGGRSVSGELRPFKSAIGLLALASAVPIVPVYIRGAYEAFPKGGSIIKHHPVRVTFGPAIPIEPYLGRLDREGVADLARHLTDDVQAAVESLRGPPAEAGPPAKVGSPAGSSPPAAASPASAAETGSST